VYALNSCCHPPLDGKEMVDRLTGSEHCTSNERNEFFMSIYDAPVESTNSIMEPNSWTWRDDRYCFIARLLATDKLGGRRKSSWLTLKRLDKSGATLPSDSIVVEGVFQAFPFEGSCFFDYNKH